MSKKFIFLIGLLVISIFTFATSFSFATDDIVNNTVDGARNMVNDAERAVEDTVKDMGNTVQNSANKAGDNMNNSSNYNANRTATTRNVGTDSDTFLGMNSTAWTWITLAVAAVVIVALVWYYSNKMTNNRRFDDGE